MSAKKSTKREFDWRQYSKPARLLTPAQEAELLGGFLRPLLDLALADSALSLQIRARQATLYHRGVSLVRLSGAEPPFTAQIDANLRLPRTERTGAELLETWPLADAADVAALLGEARNLCEFADTLAAEETAAPARDVLMRFAEANGPHVSQAAELVVVDVEYQYGRRRFDFVAMRRATGVGGLGAFTTPRLVIGELFTGDRAPSAPAGLITFGAEAAQFAHALSGEHLDRAKAELTALAAQKIRLGLLSPDLPFSHFTASSPELLVAFTPPSFSQSSLDASIAEMHDRAVARHFPAELIEFAAIGDARSTGGHSLAVAEDDVLPYRAFKGMRKRLQG